MTWGKFEQIQSQTKIKEEGKLIHIVMTGTFPEHPDSPYMQELHDLIQENNLESQISFLGLIPREDQLLLMKHAPIVGKRMFHNFTKCQKPQPIAFSCFQRKKKQ